MQIFALLLALGALAAGAPTASTPKEAPAAEKVRRLRVGLGKVLSHSSALSPSIAAEAKHVDDDAALALRGSAISDEAGLEKVLAEFAAFSKHLTSRSDELRKQDAAHFSSALPEGALEKAKAMLPGLEGKVLKIVGHLKAEKAPETPEHAKLVATLEHALATVPGQNAFDRAVALHNSLQAAHDFFGKRAQELAADRERLDREIQEQEAYVLFMMLQQRRKLPMKAQMALLKRHQFKDSSFAKKLLQAHSTKQPLDEQLLAMVPKALADKLRAKTTKGPAGSLSAAGSDGRVMIVSSRMKNAVQSMAAELTKAKAQLEEVVKGNSVKGEEKKQAKEIIVGLEEVLKKVSSTHDLKSQMSAMDEMQAKLKTWMINAAKHS